MRGGGGGDAGRLVDEATAGLVGKAAARGSWAAERSIADELGDDGGVEGGLSIGMHA